MSTILQHLNNLYKLNYKHLQQKEEEGAECKLHFSERHFVAKGYFSWIQSVSHLTVTMDTA